MILGGVSMALRILFLPSLNMAVTWTECSVVFSMNVNIFSDSKAINVIKSKVKEVWTSQYTLFPLFLLSDLQCPSELSHVSQTKLELPSLLYTIICLTVVCSFVLSFHRAGFRKGQCY